MHRNAASNEDGAGREVVIGVFEKLCRWRHHALSIYINTIYKYILALLRLIGQGEFVSELHVLHVF